MGPAGLPFCPSGPCPSGAGGWEDGSTLGWPRQPEVWLQVVERERFLRGRLATSLIPSEARDLLTRGSIPAKKVPRFARDEGWGLPTQQLPATVRSVKLHVLASAADTTTTSTGCVMRLRRHASRRRDGLGDLDGEAGADPRHALHRDRVPSSGLLPRRHRDHEVTGEVHARPRAGIAQAGPKLGVRAVVADDHAGGGGDRAGAPLADPPDGDRAARVVRRVAGCGRGGDGRRRPEWCRARPLAPEPPAGPPAPARPPARTTAARPRAPRCRRGRAARCHRRRWRRARGG